MFRKKQNKGNIAKSTIYSIGLHLGMIVVVLLSTFVTKKENKLLTDIEIAGEGEFREAFEKTRRLEPDDTMKEMVDELVVPEIPEESIVDKSVLQQSEAPVPTPAPVLAETLHPESSEPLKVEQPSIPPEVPEPPAPETAPEPEQKPQSTSEEAIPPLEKSEDKKNEKDDLKKKENPAKEKKSKNKSVINRIEKKKEKQQKIKPKSPPKNTKKSQKDLAKKLEKRRQKMLDLVSNASKDNNKVHSDDGSVNASGRGEKGMGAGASGSGTALTESDYEIISRQIYPHWIVPSGVRDAEDIIIEIHIELGDSGEVIPSSIRILDQRRYINDQIFRAAADSARRAILEASPLNIPKEKLHLLRSITMQFDLKKALRE